MKKELFVKGRWEDPWVSSLEPMEKLMFFYLCDHVSSAGFLETDWKVVELSMGLEVGQGKGLCKVLTRSYAGGYKVYMWPISERSELLWLPAKMCIQFGSYHIGPTDNARISSILECIKYRQYAWEYVVEKYPNFMGLTEEMLLDTKSSIIKKMQVTRDNKGKGLSKGLSKGVEQPHSSEAFLASRNSNSNNNSNSKRGEYERGEAFEAEDEGHLGQDEFYDQILETPGLYLKWDSWKQLRKVLVDFDFKRGVAQLVLAHIEGDGIKNPWKYLDALNRSGKFIVGAGGEDGKPKYKYKAKSPVSEAKFEAEPPDGYEIGQIGYWWKKLDESIAHWSCRTLGREISEKEWLEMKSHWPKEFRPKEEEQA